MSLKIQSAIRNVNKLLKASGKNGKLGSAKLRAAPDVEFIIWGVPPGEQHENVLHTKSKSMAEAQKIIKILETEHGCKKCRVQVLDLTKAPDFSKVFSNTSASTVVTSRAKKTKILAMLGMGSKPNLRLLNKLVSRGTITAQEVVDAVGEALFLKRVNKRVIEAISMALMEALSSGSGDVIDIEEAA